MDVAFGACGSQVQLTTPAPLRLTATSLILLSEFCFSIWNIRNGVRFNRKELSPADITSNFINRVNRVICFLRGGVLLSSNTVIFFQQHHGWGYQKLITPFKVNFPLLFMSNSKMNSAFSVREMCFKHPQIPKVIWSVLTSKIKLK